MNEFWLLNFCLLFGIPNAVTYTPFAVNKDVEELTVIPKEQVVKEYDDVVIDCFSDMDVFWKRKNDKPLPKHAKKSGNRLLMYRIRHTDGGYYQCVNKFGSVIGEGHVKVIKGLNIYDFNKRKKVTSYTTSATALTTLDVKFSTTTDGYSFSKEFFTQDPFLDTSTALLTPYPCLYGLCNGTCCVGTGVESFFDCANGEKINKSLVCNQHNDCEDGSDEAKCAPWPPKITFLPEQKVEVFCGDEDKSKAGILILECRSVGHPIPLIKWKKYEGNVPSKCVQTSQAGRGRLECPDFHQSDQGAYSCVAENFLKSAESQPKAVAKCSNVINCKGFRIVNEEQIEHCLECYCSGKTSQCQNIKSNLTLHNFPFPETKTEVFFTNDGEIVFIPSKNKLSPDPEIRKTAKEVTYCSLPEEDLQTISFLKSFGRNLIIPRFKRNYTFLPQAPDLIIQGNNLSLIYTFNRISPSSENSEGVAVRLWPGNWQHIDKKFASREDLMRVLSNVHSLLFRCEYVEGQDLNLAKTTAIILQSSAITNFTNSVSYVEKCNCPAGYDGLSCESCAEGYRKKIDVSDFVCEKIYVPPKSCDTGYIGTNCSNCDESKGYVKQGDKCIKFTCDPIGSISATPNFLGKCKCKEGVTGDFCEKCKTDHFYLQKDKGCSKCWCSGVTDHCASSKLFKTVISKTPHGGYNSSDGRNFWLLPSDFSGNRLTSYGGYLNYTMKYKPSIPKENTYLTVEFLSMDDETLTYTHSFVDKSTLTEEKSWSVPIIEQKWRKSDKSSITRGEFLSVLSKIKAIYIESPYHLSSGQANLTSTRMTSATPYGDDDSELALEVEQCNCPVGYSGLSCESCSEGYYKKRNGSIIQCLKCNCSYCDPEFGCPDCPGMTYRVNPEHEKMPVCKSCPCNNNALGCSKDDYDQIICRCKPGFTGMRCEKKMIYESDHDLTVRISPRKIQNKKVGSEISFNCSYSGKEEMFRTAQKTFEENYQNSLLTFPINSVNTFVENNWTITNYKVVLEDGLEFLECFLHDTQNKLAGHVRAVVEGLITVVKPVKITNCYSTVIEVKESESKDLICEATGSPPPMITWYKAKENKTAEKIDTVEGVHSIESATFDQNGTIYTCIAENSEGDKATCPKVLIVKKKCEIVTIIPSEIREEEGRNISMLCKTSAKSEVTWSRMHKALPVRSYIENGYLKITNVTKSDSGTYVCEAKGQYNSTINSTAIVIIEEKKIPPSVIIPDNDKILQVGDTFEVKCIGFGKPEPTVRWKKLDDVMNWNVYTSGNSLTISKAMLKNTGIYVCEGFSYLGNATAFISIEVTQFTVSPTINLSSESIKAYVGEEISVTCTVKSYPEPKVNWYMSSAIPFSQKDYSRTEDVSGSTDTLKSVKETIKFKGAEHLDGGVLICHASSGNLTAEKSAKITILQRAKSSTNESLHFAPLGSYFVLQCGSIHDNVTWTKKGGLLGDECKRLNELMFESVQVQHNGTYICETQSKSKEIIHLIVVGFVPKFNQSLRSFMVLAVHLKTPLEVRLELFFNPKKENGLLLQRDNHIMDLYLKGKKIHLGVYSKDGDFFDIVVKEELVLQRWYSLIVTISSQYVDITIYDENSFIYGRKTESSKDLNINIGSGKEMFFIGGAKPSMSMRHPHRVFQTNFPSFDGCISRLRVNQHEFDLVKESSYSEKVNLCNKCAEEPNICRGEGKCYDAPTQYGYICVCPRDGDPKSVCPAGCTGKGCETQLDLCKLLSPCSKSLLHKCINGMYHLQCDCAYGYSGATCDRAVEYAFCTEGEGYVRLPNLFERHLLNQPEVIDMTFTLNNPEGLLLWQGNKNNYLSISVADEKLTYIYYNQNSVLTVTTVDDLPLKTKVTLYTKRMNNTITLALTHSGQTKAYRNNTRFTTNRVFGDIYLGNTPKNIQNRYKGLMGCINYVTLGDNKPKIDLLEKELERKNVYSPKLESEEGDSDETNSVDIY